MMRWFLRGLAALIGTGAGIIGFFFWILSNDGVADETRMKLTGAALMAIGVVLVGGVIVAVLRLREP